MSQQQPQKQQSDQPPRSHAVEPIRYGDVFNVSGQLARKPIAPQDAAAMQAAENKVLGQTQKGGVAAVMQSAADINVRSGAVKRDEVTHIAREEGVSVTQANVPGGRVTTESIGGQVVGRYVEPEAVDMKTPAGALDRDAVTIGEALEASALSAGDKPVDQVDAAAIQAAEARAVGSNVTVPGGIASAGQAAATHNTRTFPFEEKTKLSDLLTDATDKLPGDKAVTREDAERVIGAELRNNPHMTTSPGGVAESIAAAARLNQNK